MTPDELVEKVARVIAEQLGDDWDDNVHTFCGDDWRMTPDGAKEACRSIARAALTVALEQAEKVAGPSDVDGRSSDYANGRKDAAAAIRALIGKGSET